MTSAQRRLVLRRYTEPFRLGMRCYGSGWLVKLPGFKARVLRGKP